MAITRLLANAAVLFLVAIPPSRAETDWNNPTGSHGLILIDKLGAHVRFFDPSSLEELANLPVGVNPHDLVISPDHKTAYVPIYGDGIYGRNPHPGHEIAVIDLAAHKLVGTIDVAPYQAPHGIQIDSAGTLYVSCDLSRKLLVIDSKKRSIEAAIDTEGTGHWVAILPDASKAYIANKNDKPFVSVIDLKTRKMIGRVPAPNGTQGIVASPDGTRVLAMDYSDPAVIVIDSKTDTVVDRITLAHNTKGAFKVRYTPDGSKILTCSDNGSYVNILDARDLHGPQRVMTVGKAPMGFAFSPDGRTALVANHGDGSVSVIDLGGAGVIRNFHAGTGIETLAYY